MTITAETQTATVTDEQFETAITHAKRAVREHYREDYVAGINRQRQLALSDLGEQASEWIEIEKYDSRYDADQDWVNLLSASDDEARGTERDDLLERLTEAEYGEIAILDDFAELIAEDGRVAFGEFDVEKFVDDYAEEVVWFATTEFAEFVRESAEHPVQG